MKIEGKPLFYRKMHLVFLITMSVNDVFETNIIKGVCHSSCHFTTLLLAMVVVELQHVKQVEQENA